MLGMPWWRTGRGEGPGVTQGRREGHVSAGTSIGCVMWTEGRRCCTNGDVRLRGGVCEDDRKAGLGEGGGGIAKGRRK